jgi:hypothetical protein
MKVLEGKADSKTLSLHKQSASLYEKKFGKD